MADFASIPAKLAELRMRYAKELPGRIARIRSVLNALRKRWDPGQLNILHRHTHSLTGSGATFGYAAVSKTARKLELMLKSHIESQATHPPEQWRKWDDALTALEGAVQVTSPPVEIDAVTMPSARVPGERRLLYLVQREADLAREQRMLYEMHGYAVRVFCALGGLEQALRDQPPLAMVVDTLFVAEDMAGIQAIAELKRRMGTFPPIVFASCREDLPARLEAVRAGAAAYVVKPVDLRQVIAILDRLTAAHVPEPYRILIVEDDEALAYHHALLLQRAGMETRVLSKPEQLLKLMADFQPDLVLLDLYLPGCTGIELAAVIRQQVADVGTPILFLSIETDIGKHLDAIRAGGDEFLTKPVPETILLVTVASRAHRARAMATLMMRDRLTGLLNQTAIEEALKRELSQHLRHATGFSYVMMGLDHFKQINDRYGQATGDEVLRGMAQLLRHRLRQTDLIGRIRGDQFVAVLPGTNAHRAARLANELRAAFVSLKFKAGGQYFSVQFSAGVASVPPIEDIATLLQQTDRALYQAKAAGRNQAIIAEHVE